MRIKEGAQIRKQCIVSLYGFEEIYNRKVVPSSVVIDCYLFSGNESKLIQLGEEFKRKNIKSYLIFDGKETVLLSEIWTSLDELVKQKPFYYSKDINLNTNIFKMIVFPGTINLKTGKKSVVRKVFK